MAEKYKLKLPESMDADGLVSFLTFHQFPFEKETDTVVDLDGTEKVDGTYLLIDKDKLDEFKVLACIFKDLKVSDRETDLGKKMEEGLKGAEETPVVVEEESPFVQAKKYNEEIEDPFFEDTQGESAKEKGTRSKRDHKSKDKDHDDKPSRQRKERSLGMKIFLIILWAVIVGILVLIYLLIR